MPSEHTGVYMVYGLPGAGKTYTLTRIALSYLRQGRMVVTDFPVSGCYCWDPQLLRMDCPYAVYDAVVILDEAYKYFNSRRFKDFSARMHEFFSLHRHNGVSIYLGTQHPARLDVIIRELCDYYVAVSNISIIGRPLWFASRYYDVDPCTWPAGPRPRPHHTRRYFFRYRVAAAYNTHQLRSSLPPIELARWEEREPAAARPQSRPAARARAVWDRISFSLHLRR